MDVAEEIVAAKKRGVNVNVILDDVALESEYSKVTNYLKTNLGKN